MSKTYKIDEDLYRLDSCMRALQLLRDRYDPFFDDNTPYAIVAATTNKQPLASKHLDWLKTTIFNLNEAISTLNVTSGMLVDARDLLESIHLIAEGTDKSPDEVFAWWTNRSKKNPVTTDDPPPSS